MHRNLMVAIAGTMLLALGGCAGKSAVKAPAPAASAGGGTSTGTEAGGGAPGGAGSEGAMAGSGVSGPAGVGRVVYFDLDSSQIRPGFAALMLAHAGVIEAHGTQR